LGDSVEQALAHMLTEGVDWGIVDSNQSDVVIEFQPD
jgi:hypothetical protein